jgi:predicted N-acetyltransferase YhbS
MEKTHSLQIRQGAPADLPAINDVVKAAVMAWPLPPRLRRLSVPVLRYDAADMADYELLLGHRGGQLVGIAAWCARPAAAGAASPAHALLHGLYVDPTQQRQGIGRSLQEAVARRAVEARLEGILVKAERVSRDYFARCGYQTLPIEDDPPSAYPYRFWMALPHSAGTTGAVATQPPVQGAA